MEKELITELRKREFLRLIGVDIKDVKFSNSETDQIHLKFQVSSFFQIGSGVPQYLFLETAQSLAHLSHFQNLHSRKCFGVQFIFLLFSKSFSLISSTFINQVFVA